MNEALSLPGNSNSNHMAGWQASKFLEIRKREIAELIGANAAEHIVTSGATEANALVPDTVASPCLDLHRQSAVLQKGNSGMKH